MKKNNKNKTIKKGTYNVPIQNINKIFSKYNDFDNKLSLGRTYKYNLEKSYIKIYYDNDRLICQTPMLYVPYKPRINKFKINTNDNDNYYICDVDFFNEEYDEEVNLFQKWLLKLEHKIYQLLKKRHYLKIKKKDNIPLLKKTIIENVIKLY